MQNLNIAIANVIRKYRNNVLLSQEKLAEEVGIHRTYVSQIERGLKSPTLHILLKFASTFNISLTQLIQDIEDELYAL